MMRIERPHNQGAVPFAAVSNVATAIASRMNAILPDKFTCIANETSVILVRDHVGVRSLDLADAPDWPPETWAEDLGAVLWQVLSDFQDEIVDQIRLSCTTIVSRRLVMTPPVWRKRPGPRSRTHEGLGPGSGGAEAPGR